MAHIHVVATFTQMSLVSPKQLTQAKHCSKQKLLPNTDIHSTLTLKSFNNINKTDCLKNDETPKLCF